MARRALDELPGRLTALAARRAVLEARQRLTPRDETLHATIERTFKSGSAERSFGTGPSAPFAVTSALSPRRTQGSRRAVGQR